MSPFRSCVASLDPFYHQPLFLFEDRVPTNPTVYHHFSHWSGSLKYYILFLDEAHGNILADFCPLRLRLQHRQRTNGSSQRFKVQEKSQLSPLSLGNFQHWNLVSSHFPPMHGYHYPVIRSTPSFGTENHVETFGNHQEFSPPIGWEMWKGGEFKESPSGVLLKWCTLSCTGTVQVRFISPWMNHHEQQWVRAKLVTCDDELMDPKTKNQSSFCPTLCNAQTRLTSRPDQHSHRPWRSKWPYPNGYWVYPFRTLLEDSSHHNICPIWETLKQTGQTHLRQSPNRKPCLGKVAPLHKVDCICIHTCVSLQLECLSERLTNCTQPQIMSIIYTHLPLVSSINPTSWNPLNLYLCHVMSSPSTYEAIQIQTQPVDPILSIFDRWPHVFCQAKRVKGIICNVVKHYSWLLTNNNGNVIG